jgi:hypothetical protein
MVLTQACGCFVCLVEMAGIMKYIPVFHLDNCSCVVLPSTSL